MNNHRLAMSLLFYRVVVEVIFLMFMVRSQLPCVFYYYPKHKLIREGGNCSFEVQRRWLRVKGDVSTFGFSYPELYESLRRYTSSDCLNMT